MMHLVPLLTLLLLTAKSVSAGCYYSGVGSVSYANTNAAVNVRNACSGWYSGSNYVRGALQEVYFKSYGESPYPATVCVDVNNGVKHLIIQVTNFAEGRTLSIRDCEDGLLSEVSNCGSGGESDKWGWRFRVDPESGRC